MAALTCVSSGKSLAKDLDNFMAAGDDLATLGASVGCFVAGTLIRTLEDEKKLEDIQEGDLVLSYEASEGIFASKEVLEVVAHEGVTELAHVTIGEDTADGAYTGTETIDSTTNHPYFVVGYGFVEAGNLRPGDTILLANGENRKVDSVEIEFLDDPVTVYNFEVADWHTYFVGNTGVLVHNANIQACSDAASSAGGNGKAGNAAGAGDETSHGKPSGSSAYQVKSNYSNLKDSKSVGAGKRFTSAQKKKIIQQNIERNGGVIKSDLSGEILVPATKSQKGVTPNLLEVHIDHIDPRSKGGKNSYSNAQVLSRYENIKKI